MIALIPGIVSAFIGWGIGRVLGFWKALIVAAVTALILINVPWGIWIAEFPIGVFVGGLVGLGPRRRVG